MDFETRERVQEEDVTRDEAHVYAVGHAELTGEDADLVEVLVLDEDTGPHVAPRSVFASTQTATEEEYMGFLIGAYGLFWQRNEVSWGDFRPWQLLGHRTTEDGVHALCDFTNVPGFYVLYDDYAANYVGLARGRQGIGARLVDHHRKKVDGLEDWSRFSWFSIAPVNAIRPRPGWYEAGRRDELNLSPEIAVREFEALLIKLLGSRRQRQMRFQNADRWYQLTQNVIWVDNGIGDLDPAPIRDWILKATIAQIQEGDA